MKKLSGISLFIFFCIVTAIIVAGLVFYQDNKSISPVNSNTQNVKNTVKTSSNAKVLDVNEVAKHNTVSDCWMIINNKVYDISNYASSHPGGVRNILNYCGKESTQAFDTKGGQGDPHSSRAQQMLEKDYIGNLNEKLN